MKKWLQEPLLHFLVLGTLIFAVNDRVNDDEDNEGNRIVVTRSQQENLANTFARTWQRPPTETELNSLIVDFIRQEIAYRESQAMQLDRDDIVIRRRLRQKLEMLAEDVASLASPTEEEAKAYFAEHGEDFRQAALVSMQQIYFKNDENTDTAQQDASNVLERLRRDETSVDTLGTGDPSLLARELDNVSESELDSLFGTGFAGALRDVDEGVWVGPIASAFGLHLVKVDKRVESRLPDFEEVSDYVTRELLVMRRRQAINALYAKLSENYAISIEASPDIFPEKPPGLTP
jgi:hypothetical protein